MIGSQQVTDFHYERLTMMNETNEIFKYTVKGVDKINETSFVINSEADLLIDLNDDWSVSSISRLCFHLMANFVYY